MIRKGFLVAFGVLQLFVGSLLGGNLLKEGPSAWTVPDWKANALTPQTDSTVFHAAGRNSIRLDGAQGRQGLLSQLVSCGGECGRFKFSCWIKTQDFQNSWSATARVSFHGEKGVLSENLILATPWQLADIDWREFSADFALPAGTRSLFLYIGTGSPKGTAEPPNCGTAWFDDITLTRSDVPLADAPGEADSSGISAMPKIKHFAPLGECGLFVPRQSVDFTLELSDPVKSSESVDVRLDVRDFYDAVIARRSETLSLAPGKPPVFTLMVPTPSRLGFHSVRLILEKEGHQIDQALSSFCVCDPPEKPDSFFGFSTFGCMGPRVLRLLGVGSVGFGIRRGAIEKVKGTYDFKSIDRKIQDLQEQGICIDGHFQVSGSEVDKAYWGSGFWCVKEFNERIAKKEHPYPPEYFDSWGGFVEAVVSRYKGIIHEWSMVEEIDLTMAHPYVLEHYVNKVKTTYAAAKKIDPDCVIGGVGVSGVDGQKNPRFPEARKVWPLVKDDVDFMDFDPYIDPNTYGPGYHPIGPEQGNFQDILKGAQELAGQYGKGKEIAVCEKGIRIALTVPVDSPFAKNHATEVSRNLIIAKALPFVRHYLLFSANTCVAGDKDWGLWDRKAHPRPAVAAYATTATLLAGASDAVGIEMHKDLYGYSFHKKNGSMTTLWTPLDERVSVLVELPGTVDVFDLMGNRVDTLLNGKREIVLTNAPIFLSSTVSPEAMAAAFQSASYSLPLVKGAMKFSSVNTLVLSLINQTDRELHASIAMQPMQGAGWVTPSQDVAIGKNATLLVRIGLRDVDVACINRKECAAIVEVEGHRSTIKGYIDLWPVARLYGSVTVDANLEKYKNITPLRCEDVGSLFPVDAATPKLWTGSKDLSYKAWLAYDDKYLYFAAEVTDDKFVQNKKDEMIWANDSFQIAFDTMNDALPPSIGARLGFDANDYFYGMALTTKGPQTYCWNAAEENKKLENSAPLFPLAIKRLNETTTAYELAIPWSALAPLTPEPGRVFGLNFIYMDSDEDKTCSYGMALTAGIFGGVDPSAYRTFYLAPAQ